MTKKFEEIFKPEELVSKLFYDRFEDKNGIYLLFDDNLKETIEVIRSEIDRPMICNNWAKQGQFQQRGFRSYDCSIGAPKSAHKEGKAIDFDIVGYTAEQARNLIVQRCIKKLTHPIRIEEGVNWIHIDVREFKGTHKIHFFQP